MTLGGGAPELRAFEVHAGNSVVKGFSSAWGSRMEGSRALELETVDSLGPQVSLLGC